MKHYYTTEVVLQQEEEYDLFVNGEPKSLVKFYIHPDSAHQVSWITDSGNREGDLYTIPIIGGHVEIDKEILNSSSPPSPSYNNILYDEISKIPYVRHGTADWIITNSCEIIAENAATIGNKSVTISIKVHVKDVLNIEEEDIMETLDGPRVLENASQEICAICLEQLLAGSIVMSLHCSHQFHQKCITEWFQSSYSCPTCRFDNASMLLKDILIRKRKIYRS